MSNPSSNPSSRSVVLLSGGLDSSANLAIACEREPVELALTCDYGQKAAKKEIEAAGRLAQYYGVRHQILDLTWLGRLGGSSLTSESKVPEIGAHQLDTGSIIRETAKQVWVPNRNGVLINVAAAFADRLGAGRVIVGFNREEAATFPDNSLEYLNRCSDALALSTANGARVFCYTTSMTKIEIVAELRRLKKPFPFDRIWSCYLGGEQPCGTCESCQRLKRAMG
ncbi:MAG: 7-cyano-7-deazaguanine synthase QueC [Bdellovibrionales bacterium]|nr:7-cyano-7-deazaguanine synthase QueC [Bdellovibrionales bacterium]